MAEMADDLKFGGCTIKTLRAASNNYTYILEWDDGAAVIDPTDGPQVWAYVERSGHPLLYVLNTHHHYDHTGGNRLLVEATGAEVVGPDSNRIPGLSMSVQGGDQFSLGPLSIRVIATPGHCRADVSFLAEGVGGEPDALFCGDTLFVGGCGGLFECAPDVLFDSLQLFSQLPEDTLVFCGHDITRDNYRFALSIVPDHEEIQQRLADAVRKGESGVPTVPSTIGEEKKTNIFLLAGDLRVKEALGMESAEDAAIFAELRRRKDHF